MPLPSDPTKHEAYRAKLREARIRQGHPSQGTKYSAERRAAMSAGMKASPLHRSKHQSGSKNTQFVRGSHLDKNGYRVLSIDGKYVFEHRHVMERVIGRKLLSHETVHHKNGQRADNRESNLELWSSRNPRGQRIEDKVAFAKEILALYGEMMGAFSVSNENGVHPEDEFLS